MAGNATRIDWDSVCPCGPEDEVYVLGNPPYLGSKVQNKNHKEDMESIFEGQKGFKDLDYISCWFVKAVDYIKTENQKFSFVTTNSICQGTQVAMLWPKIFGFGGEIFFCYHPFKWSNNAKRNAGVTVTIIGVRIKNGKDKWIYGDGLVSKVDRINGYLTTGGDSIVTRSSKSIVGLPKMDFGNAPYDGGNLILSGLEKDQVIIDYPSAEPLIKKLYGTNEYIKGRNRWCLWIEDKDLGLANSIPPIADRIVRVKEKRESSTDKGTRKLATRPHQFREMKSAKKQLLIVSRVSSERRDYIPMGLLNSDCIISDAQVIYDPPAHVFGILCSKMHVAWVKATSGCLDSRIRYSSAVSYNNFPFPELADEKKNEIFLRSLEVLAAREAHPEKSIEALYDPDKMPEDLKCAHRLLDECIDGCYRAPPFKDDDERLECLFEMYEEMTGGKNA